MAERSHPRPNLLLPVHSASLSDLVTWKLHDGGSVNIASAFQAGRRADGKRHIAAAYSLLKNFLEAQFSDLYLINQNCVLLPLLAAHKTGKCSYFGWAHCHLSIIGILNSILKGIVYLLSLNYWESG